MNLTRRRGAVLGASLVLALPLASCSEGDAEPKMAPTQSVASTPSGEPSGEPSDGASSAVPTSKRDQQQAFLDAYFAAITEAIGSGDVRTFLRLSSPSCQNCQVISRNISEAYSGGGRVEGGDWKLESAKFDKHDDIGDIWNVEVRTAEETWLDGSGEVVKTITPDLVRMALALTSAGDGWQVREMRLR